MSKKDTHAADVHSLTGETSYPGDAQDAAPIALEDPASIDRTPDVQAEFDDSYPSRAVTVHPEVHPDQYGQLATISASGQWHNNLIDYLAYREVLESMIAWGNKLDAIKKAVWYKRSLPDAYAHLSAIPGREALNAFPDKDDDALLLWHGIVGKVTEGVELLEALYAYEIGRETNGRGEFDLKNIGEELGDDEWYSALIRYVLDMPQHAIQQLNINKLLGPGGRFHKQFNAWNAQQENRNLDSERAILEGDGSATSDDLRIRKPMFGDDAVLLVGTVMDFMEGIGASEDHASIKLWLKDSGFSDEQTEAVMWRLRGISKDDAQTISEQSARIEELQTSLAEAKAKNDDLRKSAEVYGKDRAKFSADVNKIQEVVQTTLNGRWMHHGTPVVDCVRILADEYAALKAQGIEYSRALHEAHKQALIGKNTSRYNFGVVHGYEYALRLLMGSEYEFSKPPKRGFLDDNAGKSYAKQERIGEVMVTAGYGVGGSVASVQRRTSEELHRGVEAVYDMSKAFINLPQYEQVREAMTRAYFKGYGQHEQAS